MIDSKSELEPKKEPRNGIAPFAAGIEIDEEGNVSSKIFPLKAIGAKARMLLYNTHKLEEDYPDNYAKYSAYTISPTGEIVEGKVLDFLEEGYFPVRVNIDYVTEESLISTEDMRVSIWLNNREPIITDFADIVSKTKKIAYFENYVRRNVFMLPNDPEILQAIRVNVSIGEMAKENKGGEK